jgi:NAD-dependent DNA ligase
LIQGEDDRISSKAKKAKELGITVINESQLNDLLNK